MKARSWKVLEDVARVKQDATASRVARMIMQHGEMEQKMLLLLDYREDYRSRLAQAQAQGIHGERLRNYQQFLANLQGAIEQQAEIIANLQQQLTDARQSLAGERRKVDSYGVLDGRQKSLARTSDQRRQQTIHDEFAANSFLKHVAGGDD